MKAGLVSLILLMPLVSIGSNYFFCSKANTYVYLGDTIEKVDQACGPPSSSDIKNSTQTVKSQQIEQWIYNFQPNSGFRAPLGEMSDVVFKKNALVINFDGEYISQIFVEGKQVYSTHFCRPDLALYTGDTRQTVIQFCSSPSVTRNIVQDQSSHSARQIVYTYKVDNYTPPTQLTFENGKLISIDEAG